MNEKELIIESMAKFFKENDYRSENYIDMYNAWSLSTKMLISQNNVIFAIKTLKELMDVK